jgi:hypothetical protein
MGSKFHKIMKTVSRVAGLGLKAAGMAFPEAAPITTALGVANKAIANRYLG